MVLSSLPLLSIQPFADADAAPIFSDGFESGGFSAWTGTASYRSGVTASLQTTVSVSVPYAVKVAVADGTGEAGFCIYKNLGSTYSSVNARVYVQLNAKPANDATLEVFGFSNDGWLPNAVGTRVDIVNINGVLQWRLNYYNDGWKSAYAGQISLNTWY
ncbi:MAG: hypothetical protein ACQCN4_12040, partial [Candidatus Bathyarchaeia archaeon]